MTPNADGGFSVAIQVQGHDARGNTTTTTTRTTTDKNGNVSDTSTITTYGSIGSPTSTVVTGDSSSSGATETTLAAVNAKLAAVTDDLTQANAVVAPSFDANRESNIQDLAAAQTAVVNDIKSAINTDKNLWFSWVWTPPVGQCHNPSGSVSGFAVNWDICSTVEDFRDLLGFLFAIFTAWDTYNVMFRKGDS
jgi:hypothetical protein